MNSFHNGSMWSQACFTNKLNKRHHPMISSLNCNLRALVKAKPKELSSFKGSGSNFKNNFYLPTLTTYKMTFE